MTARKDIQFKSFARLLTILTVLFFLLLGMTTYIVKSSVAPTVPLKPCKQCTTDCPCPRLSGSVRCGCPN